MCTEGKVYNNDNIAFFPVTKRLPSPWAIMCCSSHRYTAGAALHYCPWAWQTLMHGNECLSSY